MAGQVEETPRDPWQLQVVWFLCALLIVFGIWSVSNTSWRERDPVATCKPRGGVLTVLGDKAGDPTTIYCNDGSKWAVYYTEAR
jgi:hypothetical protein